MSTVSKPFISTEARHRLRSFIHEVECLQERWRIQIVVDDGMINLRDINRQEPFLQPNGEDVYGKYDAYVVYTDELNGFTLKNLRLEDFDAWGK